MSALVRAAAARLLLSLTAWPINWLAFLRIQHGCMRWVLDPVIELILSVVNRTKVLPGHAKCPPQLPACPRQARYLALRDGRGELPPDPRTAILYVHGGAYCYHTACEHGAARGLLPLCEAGTVFLAAAYSLMPSERRFATQVDQIIDCLRHLVDDLSVRHVVLVGDSAGGGLVIAVLLRLFGDADARGVAAAAPLRGALAAAVVLSPWLPAPRDAKCSASPLELLMPLPRTDWLTALFTREPARCYLAAGGPPRAEVASQLRACAGVLPPLLCVVGGGEMEGILASARAIGDALVGHGPASAAAPRHALHMAQGESHDFPLIPTVMLRDPAAPAAVWAAAAAHIGGALRAREAPGAAS